MANVKTILDTRRTKSNGTYNIIFKATKRKSIYIDTTGTINPFSVSTAIPILKKSL